MWDCDDKMVHCALMWDFFGCVCTMYIVYCKLHIVHSTGSVEFHYSSFCIYHMYALMIFEIGDYHATVFLNQHFFANIRIKFFTVFEKIDQLTISKTQSWISMEFSKIRISGLLFVKAWGDWFEKKKSLLDP